MYPHPWVRFPCPGTFYRIVASLDNEKAAPKGGLYGKKETTSGAAEPPPVLENCPLSCVETTGLDLINVWLGPYPASNSPPDCCDWICSSPVAYFPPKRKTHPDGWVSFWWRQQDSNL